MLVPVILAGGVGSRLWPLSREHYPKQFIPLVDSQHSLLQATLKRVAGVAPQSAPILVCNEEHRFLVAEQLRQLKTEAAAILLEPMARNTAPAVALAAFAALRQDPQAVLLVLPADHLMAGERLFQQAVEAGLKEAEAGKLVTFGIKPTRPETGYGYIRANAPKAAPKEKASAKAYAVAEFVEKPELQVAQSYLASGDYYWNSGMFLFQAQAYLNELQAHAPDIFDACQRSSAQTTKDMDFERVDKAAFAACRSDSIDYAVMEKTKSAVVVPLASDWNDVGAWAAIWDVSAQDSSGNVVLGDVITDQVSGSYLRAESRLLAAVGVENLVIVETADAVLVADKDQVQQVKRVVDQLKKSERSEAAHHTRVFRPWGAYEAIVSGSRFQAKRIIVNPGASLSLQLHYHRAEHWVVVKGCALVTRGEEEFRLNEDESTYIPIGVKHRLRNPGMIPLEIIEVQTGSYLGEDDIVRFEDNYGRGA